MLQFLFTIRTLPDFILLAFVLLVQGACVRAILSKAQSEKVRQAVTIGWAISIFALLAGTFLSFHSVAGIFPPLVWPWIRGLSIVWGFVSVLTAGVWVIANAIAGAQPHHSAGRRRFLSSVRWAMLGAPSVALGYGTFVQRFNLGVREQNIIMPALPKDLDGLRITQLTDIHLSPFLTVRELERAIEMANESRPHLMLVTGDLITAVGDPLDDCLRALARLKADAGVFGCMGNHEIYAKTEKYTQEMGARLGIAFLRHQSQSLRFGGAELNLAGVDYQRVGKPYLRRAENLIAPGAFNVLLSHNPDVFPVAAAKGFPLTISGHTHGGQVNVEILGANLNVARFFTPYVDGLYQKGESSIFVSRGIGTIGLPARLGAPPEVAVLKLCRS